MRLPQSTGKKVMDSASANEMDSEKVEVMDSASADEINAKKAKAIDAKKAEVMDSVSGNEMDAKKAKEQLKKWLIEVQNAEKNGPLRGFQLFFTIFFV